MANFIPRECVCDETWRKNTWMCDEKRHVLTHNEVRKGEGGLGGGAIDTLWAGGYFYFNYWGTVASWNDGGILYLLIYGEFYTTVI